MGATQEYVEDLLEKQRRVRLEAANAQQYDYEESARIFGVSAITKLPEEVVANDLPNLEKQLATNEFNYDDYTDRINGAPAFNRFVAENPFHLSVMQRDHKNLSRLERAYRQMSYSWQKGWAMTEIAEIRDRQLKDFERPDNEKDKAKLQQLHQLLEGGYFGATGAMKFLTGFSEQVPIMAWLAGESLDEIAVGYAIGAARGAFVGSAAGGVGALPGAVAGGWIGAGFGARAGFAEASFRLERGLAYDEYIGMGLDEEQARWASAAVGGVNAALESLGFGALAKRIPGINKILNDRIGAVINKMLNKPTMRQAIARVTLKYGEGVATELVTEVAQEATLIVGREYQKRQMRLSGDASPEMKAIAGTGGIIDIFTSGDFWSQAGDIAAHTLYGVAIIGGMGPGASFIKNINNIRTAEGRLAAYEAMGDAAEKSETRKNAPTKYEEFVHKLVGKDGKILIEARRFIDYFQEQGMDADEAAKNLGVKNLSDAEANGHDIEIPAGEYLTKIAGTEHHRGLVRDLKNNPDQLSANEATTVKEKMVKEVKEMQALAAKEDPEAARMDAELHNALKERLIEGNMSPEAAEFQAMIMVGIPNLARRAGMADIEQFQQERFGGVIFTTNAQMRADKEDVDLWVDPYLDMIRAGDIPTQRSIFGADLVERIRFSGGLAPDSELAARDIQKSFRGLIREGGRGLDDVAEYLHEEGYIPARDPNLVLDALDRIVMGEEVFGTSYTINEEKRELLGTLEQLERDLDEAGIDIDEMTNAEVRKALKKVETYYQTDEFKGTSKLNNLVREVMASAEHDPQMMARAMQMLPEFKVTQDFGDVSIVVEEGVDTEGRPVKVTRKANRAFELAQKRKNMLKALKDCLGG